MREVYPLYPQSVSDLNTWCRQYTSLSVDDRYCPGFRMDQGIDKPTPAILGTYGIVRLDPVTYKVVAKCGFNITPSGLMVIEHTPQGRNPNSLTRPERNRLLINGFKPGMMDHLEMIARNLNLEGIIGVPAILHPSFRYNKLTFVEAAAKIDSQFINSGFELDKLTGQFYLGL